MPASASAPSPHYAPESTGTPSTSVAPTDRQQTARHRIGSALRLAVGLIGGTTLLTVGITHAFTATHGITGREPGIRLTFDRQAAWCGADIYDASDLHPRVTQHADGAWRELPQGTPATPDHRTIDRTVNGAIIGTIDGTIDGTCELRATSTPQRLPVDVTGRPIAAVHVAISADAQRAADSDSGMAIHLDPYAAPDTPQRSLMTVRFVDGSNAPVASGRLRERARFVAMHHASPR